MRTLLTVTIGADAGNRANKDGSLAKVIEAFTRDFKPEAAYFTTTGGDRTAYFVFDLKDPSAMPSVAEPFFMALNARAPRRAPGGRSRARSVPLPPSGGRFSVTRSCRE
jgi:hypothetical protein